jgi:hypothetical protein
LECLEVCRATCESAEFCNFFVEQDTVIDIMAMTVKMKKNEHIERGVAFKEIFIDICSDSFISPFVSTICYKLQSCGQSKNQKPAP